MHVRLTHTALCPDIFGNDTLHFVAKINQAPVKPSRFAARDHPSELGGRVECSYVSYNHVSTSYLTLSNDVIRIGD